MATAAYEHVLRASSPDKRRSPERAVSSHHARGGGAGGLTPSSVDKRGVVIIGVDAMARLEERISSQLAELAATQRALQESLDEHARTTRSLRDDVSQLASSHPAGSVGGSRGLRQAEFCSPLASPAGWSPSPAGECSPLPQRAGCCHASSAGTKAEASGGERANRRSIWQPDSAGATDDQPADTLADKGAGGLNWALVESDPDVGTMLKDVRGRITEFADRNRKKEPQIADLEAEGTLYVQLLRARALPSADDNGLSDP